MLGVTICSCAAFSVHFRGIDQRHTQISLSRRARDFGLALVASVAMRPGALAVRWDRCCA